MITHVCMGVLPPLHIPHVLISGEIPYVIYRCEDPVPSRGAGGGVHARPHD